MKAQAHTHKYNGFGTQLLLVDYTIFILWLCMPALRCCYAALRWAALTTFPAFIFNVQHLNCISIGMPHRFAAALLSCLLTSHSLTGSHNSHFFKIQFLACHRLKARLLKMSWFL